MNVLTADWRHLRGTAGSRLPRYVIFIAAVGGVLGLAGLAAIIAAIHGGLTSQGACPKNQPVCVLRSRLNAGTQYLDPGNAFRFEYDPSVFAVAPQSDGTIQITLNGASDYTLILEVVPSSSASAQQLLDKRLAAAQSTFSGLSATSDPTQAVLGPQVGFRSGVGGVYSGNSSSPQGSGSQVQLILMASSNGQTTAAVSLAISATDPTVVQQYRGQTDQLLGSFRFASDFQARVGGRSRPGWRRAPT